MTQGYDPKYADALVFGDDEPQESLEATQQRLTQYPPPRDTAEHTLHHSVPCPRCTYDLDNLGVELQHRMAVCETCGGEGTIPKIRMMRMLYLEAEQRIAEALEVVEHPPATGTPYTIAGTMTLAYSLSRGPCAIGMVAGGKPYRVLVRKTSRGYSAYLENLYDLPGSRGFPLYEDASLSDIDLCLDKSIWRVELHGWRPFDPHATNPLPREGDAP